MRNDDTDMLLRTYVIAKRSFTNGGTWRIQHTLPPLVFATLALSRRVFAREKVGLPASISYDRVPPYLNEAI